MSTYGRRPSVRPLAVLAAVAAVAAAPGCGGDPQPGGESDAARQDETGQPSEGDVSGEGAVVEPGLTVRPERGAPGSEVRIRAVGLPPNERIRLGAGPADSEYEIIAETRSDAHGEVAATVSVPTWAEPGDRFVFVAEPPDPGNGLRSAPFPVTAPDETPVTAPDETPETGEDEDVADVVEVTGRLTDEGVECQALRGDDGGLYTLAGDLQGFETGDRVRVEGRRAEMSHCMQGTTLSIVRIEEAGTP